MTFEALNFTGSVLGGVLGGAGITGIAASVLKDRWLEKVKAEYAGQLEIAKNALSLGSYITQAQLDLEIEAYKELWGALSGVLNHSRSLLSQEKFVMVVKAEQEMRYRVVAFGEAMEAFHNAHNAAVIVTERFGLFYPSEIKSAFQKVTVMDMQIVNFYATMGPETLSKPWFAELEKRVSDRSGTSKSD